MVYSFKNIINFYIKTSHQLEPGFQKNNSLEKTIMKKNESNNRTLQMNKRTQNIWGNFIYILYMATT
jgi:hypothetical protein